MPTTAISNAIAAAQGVLRRVGGVRVTYSEGGVQSDPLTANKATVDVELEGGRGPVPIEGQRTDWLINCSALVLNGTQVEPKEGATITEVTDTATNVYEVMPVGTDRHYKPLDAHGIAWRIHSKLISTTPN